MNPLLFTDPLFLFAFAPIVLVLYYLVPWRLQNIFLLLASIGFYAWGEGRYATVLLTSLALNYACALAMGRASTPRLRRAVMLLGLASNLLMLGAFKYAGFAIVNVNIILTALQVRPVQSPVIHMPVGISFFTFMGISYLIDVYRRQIDAEKSLTVFGLYITLFPHLIAGPIVRYSAIARELKSRRVSPEQVATGIRRFVVGLGKKLVIANTVAVTADKVFALKGAELTTPLAWLGVMCYTLQIYYDFSGYSDMAIGLAKMFGFTFPENFNYPYVSRSITEFWTRWHISLSTWLRDYLFFPLGVRGGSLRLYRNVLVVFVLCGLWHGADWRFVIWGLFHGVFLVFERMGLTKRLAVFPWPLRHLYVLLVLMVGWVFFRSDRIGHALGFLSSMIGLAAQDPSSDIALYFTPDLLLAICLGVMGCLPLVPEINRRINSAIEALSNPRAAMVEGFVAVARFAVVGAIFIAAVALAAAGTYNPFIYFRF